eukprot:CAMPEP_0119102890 /NCGR_PEP_ID=MMETSP1180-20130426/1486_1 /TAXON_ID=3052 ORGANISM="Chlamydomonas cf sp, Strain CCMP681" /NCGR_SAMPLE_ID=MMETSP1180 /ASSEMBLY_ACC=CAM_ASM_000741 /LENGTH=112 /DNA_ID=CAMNT_0007087267 /DNA_START=54 /DNA_END=392 /DNA_ORIENTATION=+
MSLAAKTTQTRVSSAQTVRAVAPRSLRVVCNAQAKPVEVAKKVMAAAAGLPVLLATSPAFALVDERLNGDGTGLPFGINDGALGWVIVGGLTLVWTAWWNSQKDLGDDELTL